MSMFCFFVVLVDITMKTSTESIYRHARAQSGLKMTQKSAGLGHDWQICGSRSQKTNVGHSTSALQSCFL